MSFIYGFILMFLAALSYGASAIVIKFGYNQTTLKPAELLALQNIVAIACLWPILLLSCGLPKLNRRQFFSLAAQGIIGNLGISVCYFWAAERIDVSLLGIIMFTYPGLVLVYQMTVEKRRVLPLEWLALSLAFLGVVLAVDPLQIGIGRVDRWGLGLAAGAAAAYAFMNIWGEKLTTHLPPQVITAITSSISTMGLLLFLSPGEIFGRSYSLLEWGVIVATALLSTVLPMNLMYLGIRKIGAFYASMVSVAELPCTLILAYLILHEQMNLLQAFGGGLIIASVIMLQWGGKVEKAAGE